MSSSQTSRHICISFGFHFVWSWSTKTQRRQNYAFFSSPSGIPAMRAPNQEAVRGLHVWNPWPERTSVWRQRHRDRAARQLRGGVESTGEVHQDPLHHARRVPGPFIPAATVHQNAVRPRRLAGLHLCQGVPWHDGLQGWRLCPCAGDCQVRQGRGLKLCLWGKELAAGRIALCLISCCIDVRNWEWSTLFF